MAGIPDLMNVRSFSLAGISSLMMNFNDSSDNNWNRERVLERLGMVTLPAGLVPQLQTDWSPAGQIYWYTIESKNPSIDVMEQKSIEDWTLQKQFKNVPGIVDVASFGGLTKEYQIRLDPDKLVSYGLSIAQIEQQLAINNANAGGSFIVAGAQQINVQAQVCLKTYSRLKTRWSRRRLVRPCASKTSPSLNRVPRSGWDRFQRRIGPRMAS
jgi:cobalt-zinc-cadmium resistance protein CzcA